ncbi:ATP-binding cassette domain-containing protein [Anaerofustis sp.]|uniref:ABC transporter ATP-binding protein n=1 Tax=Anaerofustis sp. TaxID=1872517 RepID=UPI0025C16008|nr:ATP-binding cassette domain-containing protein [Anaerofustis sp.]
MLKLEHVKWNTEDGQSIIKDIDLEIEDGKLIVVTGPNGGGKTSLAKLIAGIKEVSDGKIILDGEDITKADITTRAKKGIAYAFQHPVKFKGLTVRDMLKLSAGKELDEGQACALLSKVGLCAEEYINRELNDSLSGGESKRIEIAGVLARDAKLFIFDEPEAGIDLWSFSKLVETFEMLRKHTKETLMIISHQERILSIADEIIVISDGKVRARGTKEDILPTLFKEERGNMCPKEKEVADNE